MYGKTQTMETKDLISQKMSKYPLGVGIYDLDNNLIKNFRNNTQLAEYLNISRVTVGKYLNNKLVYDKKYYFKPIEE